MPHGNVANLLQLATLFWPSAKQMQNGKQVFSQDTVGPALDTLFTWSQNTLLHLASHLCDAKQSRRLLPQRMSHGTDGLERPLESAAHIVLHRSCSSAQHSWASSGPPLWRVTSSGLSSESSESSARLLASSGTLLGLGFSEDASKLGTSSHGNSSAASHSPMQDIANELQCD